MSKNPAAPPIKGYLSPSGVFHTPHQYSELAVAIENALPPVDSAWLDRFDPLVIQCDSQVTCEQPAANELLASLERFESDGEDFVKLHDVHDVVAMIKQPPAHHAAPVATVNVERPGNIEWLAEPTPDDGAMLYAKPQPPALGRGPVAALQFKCVGDRNPSDWSDVRDSLQLERMQRTNEICEARDRPACYEFRELVDRAHVDRLQAEVERLKHKHRDELGKRLAGEVKAEARTDALEGLLRESVESLRSGLEAPGPMEHEHSVHDRELVGRIDAELAKPEASVQS